MYTPGMGLSVGYFYLYLLSIIIIIFVEYPRGVVVVVCRCATLRCNATYIFPGKSRLGLFRSTKKVVSNVVGAGGTSAQGHVADHERCNEWVIANCQ